MARLLADSADDFDLTITLTGGYHLHALKRLLRQLQPLLYLDRPTRVLVDLTSLTFMGPAAMALTLATLSKAREDRTLAAGSIIRHPRSPGMYTYIHRMDFMRVLFEGTEYPEHVEKHDTKGLRECRHFIEHDAAREVAKELAQALEEKVETDDFAKISLELCLTELAENVHYHADTPHGGFAAAQAFTRTGEIEVAIVDLGVGIATSLAKNPRYAKAAENDVTAIRTAMRPTVTATPERNSGYGLAFTQFLLEMNEGRLVVRSGHGYVQIGEKAVEKLDEFPLPGTLVALRLHTDRPFDFHRAYNLLTDAIQAIEGVFDDDVRVLHGSTS